MSLTSFADLKKTIPTDWDLVANRSIYKERKEQNGEDENELLSVTQDRGIIKQSEYEVKKDSSNEDKSKYKVTYPNDLVYNKMRMWQGAVGYNDYTGIVSPAYIVLIPDNKIVPKFAYYQMKTPEYIAQSYGFSYGIVDDQNSLRYEEFRNMLTILPSRKTQQKIVNYLDKKLAKIDLFVINKETYIKKLLESKQAVINDAVVKGLDDRVELTPALHEWAGMVPKKWKQYKLRHLVKLSPTRSASTYGIEDSVVFLPMEAVEVDGTYSQEQFRPYDEVKQGYTYFEEGDVIVAKITPCFENGKGAFLKTLPTKFGYGTTEFHVMRPNESLILGEYLYLYTMTHYFRTIGTAFMTGSAGQQRISSNFVKNFPISLPEPDEQKEILKFVRNETKVFDKAIQKARQQIDLIKEYRDSLITNAVTGQITIKE